MHWVTVPPHVWQVGSHCTHSLVAGSRTEMSGGHVALHVSRYKNGKADPAWHLVHVESVLSHAAHDGAHF